MLLVLPGAGCATREPFVLSGIHRVVDAESGDGLPGVELEACVEGRPTGQVALTRAAGVVHFTYRLDGAEHGLDSVSLAICALGYRSRVVTYRELKVIPSVPVLLTRE